MSKFENRIIRLLACGLSNKQIATRVERTEKTVSTWRVKIMRKLRIFDVANLTRWAMANGIISPSVDSRRPQLQERRAAQRWYDAEILRLLGHKPLRTYDARPGDQ